MKIKNDFFSFLIILYNLSPLYLVVSVASTHAHMGVRIVFFSVFGYNTKLNNVSIFASSANVAPSEKQQIQA